MISDIAIYFVSDKKFCMYKDEKIILKICQQNQAVALKEACANLFTNTQMVLYLHWKLIHIPTFVVVKD